MGAFGVFNVKKLSELLHYHIIHGGKRREIKTSTYVMRMQMLMPAKADFNVKVYNYNVGIHTLKEACTVSKVCVKKLVLKSKEFLQCTSHK